ncbi:Putative zinc-finger [Nannocystis exedens]|uniref:Putative zinc-finger n=1 Tax=Nannocystis exedens TaxID=54 RepID=A0A1I1WXI5_9BACT|nr:CHAT domain-containing protein [Nannocystis exedens]PCC71027.1 CHAT domain protein [Nannocystis exedens]SFD98163.1 Putative zinc-finger [Nannocystis exedens]
MTRRCDDIDRYFDGELEGDARATFEAHLVDCARCQQALHVLMQLQVATGPEAAPVAPVSPLAARRRRAWWAAAPLLAAAAAIALYLRGPSGGPELGHVSEGMSQEAGPFSLALAPTRGVEARLSFAPADVHRDYSVLRAGGPVKGEPIPLSELSRLEQAGELRGLAAAHALRGELAQAQAVLLRLQPSPDRDSDLAALALMQNQAEQALALADAALAAAPGHLQARWNRALALRELGLPRLAADALERLAADDTPAWGAEARAQAEALRREPAARERSFAEVQAAGAALIERGEPFPAATIAASPSLVRLYFYDAVRAAPSRARLEALAPLAEQLDRLAGGRVLQDMLQRTAKADFTRRGPLAATYAELALGRGGDGAELVARARAARQDDIALGARVHAGLVRADLDAFTKLAESTGDPWLRMLAAQERAGAQVDAGDYAAAEATLAAAQALCGPGLGYRCARLELLQAELLVLMHRLTEAVAPLEAGARRVTQDQHWGAETTFLQLRAEVARLRGAFGLARAITGETLLRLPDAPAARCRAERHARDVLAGLAIVALDAAGARRELEAAPDCEQPPSLPRLFVQADLARMSGDRRDVDAVLVGLRALRAAGLQPGEAALADHIEGRARIAGEPEVGRALLRQAIAAARELPRSDPHALKAVSFSYASLVLDAAARGDHAAALGLFAEEVGAAAPTACALGLAVDHERGYSVALGPAGPAIGSLVTRAAPVADGEALVPEDAIAAVRACPEVAVFARPPLAGRPGLLPPEIAWSYRVARTPLQTGVKRHVTSDIRVVVADAAAPAALGLPRLSPWTGTSDAATRLLTGPEATPTRVLQALPEAGEVEFHVHGLVDLGVSDASFLALTPDADGRHALTAGQIRGVALPARPVVILGACHAGQVAPYLHEAWSLPVAFLEAGARVVIASPAPVEDREAGPFFDAVRARIRSGATPAAAVRDERVQRGGADWAAHVLVFE